MYDDDYAAALAERHGEDEEIDRLEAEAARWDEDERREERVADAYWRVFG
jgi:hypothetical protein